jgi:hypothetical protein
MRRVPTQPPDTAARALDALSILVGKWTVTARGPDGADWPGEGRASFEWHESGVHLVQRTVIGGPAPDSIANIGGDGADGTIDFFFTYRKRSPGS